MSTLASDEVAEDYKSSLEDLKFNDRFQINNLTVIAKENTEHAMAISRVLENHIRSTPSQHKLPALYLVDSIVKNVGTPYTLFLGRNMYQTFMNAYTLVDSSTRRKLDEMLKTWKEPVPGSLDTRPVFSSEITRGIESALIRARTAALKSNPPGPSEFHHRGRANGTPTGWNNTPTPPHGMPRPPPHPYANNGHTPPTNYHPNMDLESLNRDLDALVASARLEFANSPFHQPSQQRLKALLDLQGILQKQQLTPDQLKLVRTQLSALAVPQPTPSAPPQPVAAPPPAPVSTPPAQSSSQPLQQLLNPGTLAELIKATAVQQPTPPPLPSIPQVPSNSNTPPMADNPLIAALRSRGILPPAATPPNLASSSGTPPQGVPVVQPAVPSNMSSSHVPMTTASMKIPRIALIATLYETKPNRCGTCGRRFLANEEGREQKARHLDWHFNTNQRMTEAAKRAQTRSWYVDERDWIKSREVGDDQVAADSEVTAEGAVGEDGHASRQGPPKPWIRAPNDAVLRNTPCPICQEKFESTWSEEVQDWIWQDAAKIGPRVYHASCYAEVTKDGPAPRSSTPQARTGTPDSVLGKRKAEGIDSPGSKTRIKTEPA
ncbi:hypothetical protein N7512_010212 [Penicillium capsulatum]|nr:hypothetical protein N7512_010212 [Penicillium capsulatum]